MSWLNIYCLYSHIEIDILIIPNKANYCKFINFYDNVNLSNYCKFSSFNLPKMLVLLAIVRQLLFSICQGWKTLFFEFWSQFEGSVYKIFKACSHDAGLSVDCHPAEGGVSGLIT